jgi:hypothetical protein
LRTVSEEVSYNFVWCFFCLSLYIYVQISTQRVKVSVRISLVPGEELLKENFAPVPEIP